jgi:hypothetical protein
MEIGSFDGECTLRVGPIGLGHESLDGQRH